MSRGPVGGRAHARGRGGGRSIGLAARRALVGLCAAVPAGGASPPPAAAEPPVARSVTLLTGDVVRVATQPDGRRSVGLVAGPDGTVPQAAITAVGTHLYVIPRRAVPLLAAGRLDRALFDVARLLARATTTRRRSTLPIIVEYGNGRSPPQGRGRAALPGAGGRRAAAPSTPRPSSRDKRDAGAFWSPLTAAVDAPARRPRWPAAPCRVDLDGRVTALDDPDVAQQIHAPEAWAAGFDGSGVTVAVLDTGYDPTHPDLAGRVAGAQSFTGEPDAVDGNGHGTHVASTIAGTGAASDGLHKGVAPGAQLLDRQGARRRAATATDSWVIAGMQWAVDQRADVVNMSLGGDVPATAPTRSSRAVDELSASSPTLFVIAAGNTGGDAVDGHLARRRRRRAHRRRGRRHRHDGLVLQPRAAPRRRRPQARRRRARRRHRRRPGGRHVARRPGRRVLHRR